MNYENIPFNQNEHDWMVTYFQTTAPTNKDWISGYLKHIKYIIDKLQLHNSDKRFVLTLPKTISYPIFLPVIIGDRYVLGGYYRDDLDDDPSVVIILQNRFWETLSEKQKNNIEMKADLFKPYPKEIMPPVFVFLKSISGLEEMMDPWTDSMITEKCRKSGSIQKRFHRPMMYKLVTDPEYQDKFFREVF